MNIDNMILEKQLQKKQQVEKMEQKKKEFLDELNEFSKNWFDQETLNTIKSNAEKLIDLGEEKAKELKNNIEIIKERTPELVKTYMEENKSIWWHTRETKESFYSMEHRLITGIDNQIRIMFGELGRAFIESGLIRSSTQYDRNYTSNWESEGFSDAAKLKYKFSIDYSPNLHKINNEYVELIKQTQKINEELEKLEDKKKRENVEEWWKSL